VSPEPPEKKLRKYRAKRSFDATPEPGGDEAPASGHGGARFVVQEHHARRLHWDLRLERGGVLVSWALPRGVPTDPGEDRLAVHTEDHPLRYIDFHGEIPRGQYGAGTMTIWDAGTYEAEKFDERKVVVRFAGEKVRGRYALFKTKGDNWMIHRMDPAEEGRDPLPSALEPMRATPAELPRDDESWAFEIRWDGVRALAFCEPGHMRLVAAGGADVTKRFGEVRAILEELSGRDALLDGVLVAFEENGRPGAERLKRRLEASGEALLRRLRTEVPVAYVIVDLLHLDGESLLERPYEERRAQLQALGLEADAFQTPAYHRGEGAKLLTAAKEQGLGGLVAKRLTSPYLPGALSRDWLRIGPPSA